MIAIHIPCGRQMEDLPGGYFVRCIACDTIPIQRSDRSQVWLLLPNKEPAIGLQTTQSDIKDVQRGKGETATERGV